MWIAFGLTDKFTEQYLFLNQQQSWWISIFRLIHINKKRTLLLEDYNDMNSNWVYKLTKKSKVKILTSVLINLKLANGHFRKADTNFSAIRYTHATGINQRMCGISHQPIFCPWYIDVLLFLVFRKYQHLPYHLGLLFDLVELFVRSKWLQIIAIKCHNT